MTSEEMQNLSTMLREAGRGAGLPPQRCMLAADVAADLAEQVRHLENATAPWRVRVLPERLPPNVVRFETAGSLQSRRMVRDLMLWPAAVLVPMALAALAGMTP